MDKISVIVPVYNVEKYIDKCIDSIVKQTYSNLEIILVDDGSTDESGHKCDEWVTKDSRVKTIHKENGGLSDARNAGLEIATGNYIGFVDSDDWIDERMYESLYREINASNCNIALCEFLETKTEDVKKIKTCNRYEFSGRQLLKHMFEGRLEPYVTYSVWKCLYKRESITGFTFPKGRVYEDVLFTTRAFWNQEKIIVLEEKLYFYRIREESITKRKISLKQIEDIFAYCDELMLFYKKNATEEEKSYLYEAILWTILSYRNESLLNGDKEAAKALKEYKKNKGMDYSLVSKKSLKKLIKYAVWNGSRQGCILANKILVLKGRL